MVGPFLDGGVEGGGCGCQGEECAEADEEGNGVAGGEEECDAEGVAGASCCSECRSEEVFLFHFFLCWMPSDAGFLVPVSDRLGRAVGGLLKMNLRRNKMSARIIFYFSENIF